MKNRGSQIRKANISMDYSLIQPPEANKRGAYLESSLSKFPQIAENQRELNDTIFKLQYILDDQRVEIDDKVERIAAMKRNLQSITEVNLRLEQEKAEMELQMKRCFKDNEGLAQES